ncbi:MAG: MFS transporter [Nanoarchaeota archaeon]
MKSEKGFEITKQAVKKAGLSKVKENQILEDVKDKLEKERTMKLSIKEGMSSSVMSGLGDANISLYAMQLNANNAQIGFLSSFPGLVSPFSQIIGSKLMERYSRKRLILTSVSMHALMWLPILVLGLFFWANLFTTALPVMLIIFYSLYAILGAIAGPSWFSLMGDLVPEKIRGRYFSKRNKICGAIALISTLVAAFFLDFLETKGLILLGFSIIFFLASMFRLLSANLFKKHYYPKLNLKKGYYFSFWQFLKNASKNNFGKFALYVALMHLASAIAGPFFAVYMRRDLGFSVLAFTLANIAAILTTLICLPLMGKLSDKYGNRELMKLGGIIIPFIPILWLLSPSPIYIMIVPQIFTGIGWAAFNFAASNFIYDSVTPQRRGICVAYFNMLAGIGVFIGATTGGLLAQYLTISFMNKLLFIFILSAFARLTVYFIMMPKIKEVRKVKKAKENPLLYLKEIKLTREGLYSIFSTFNVLNLFNSFISRKNPWKK